MERDQTISQSDDRTQPRLNLATPHPLDNPSVRTREGLLGALWVSPMYRPVSANPIVLRRMLQPKCNLQHENGQAFSTQTASDGKSSNLARVGHPMCLPSGYWLVSGTLTITSRLKRYLDRIFSSVDIIITSFNIGSSDSDIQQRRRQQTPSPHKVKAGGERLFQ